MGKHTELSEEFGKFLDFYLEEQRLCFYTMKKYNQDDAPVDILANKALSYEEFGLPVFLKKFDLEDNIENLTKLTDFLSLKQVKLCVIAK